MKDDQNGALPGDCEDKGSKRSEKTEADLLDLVAFNLAAFQVLLPPLLAMVLAILAFAALFTWLR